MTGIRHTDVKDFWEEILSVHPQSPAVTAPVGHAAPLRCAGTSTASVPMPGTSLTLRCGPEGPSHLTLTIIAGRDGHNCKLPRYFPLPSFCHYKF